MALSQGNSVLWSDLSSVYSSLSTARTKFGFSTVTPTATQGSSTLASEITRLNSLLNEMTSNKYISSVTTVTPPAVGDLLKANFLSDLSTSITNVNNICAFDGSFFASNFSGFNASFRGSHDGFSFRSSFRSGFRSSYDSSHRSSYDSSHRSAYDSSHRSSYDSSHRSSYDSSFNSSRNGYDNFSWRGGSFNSFFTKSSNRVNDSRFATF